MFLGTINLSVGLFFTSCGAMLSSCPLIHPSQNRNSLSPSPDGLLMSGKRAWQPRGCPRPPNMPGSVVWTMPSMPPHRCLMGSRTLRWAEGLGDQRSTNFELCTQREVWMRERQAAMIPSLTNVERTWHESIKIQTGFHTRWQFWQPPWLSTSFSTPHAPLWWAVCPGRIARPLRSTAPPQPRRLHHFQPLWVPGGLGGHFDDGWKHRQTAWGRPSKVRAVFENWAVFQLEGPLKYRS